MDQIIFEESQRLFQNGIAWGVFLVVFLALSLVFKKNKKTLWFIVPYVAITLWFIVFGSLNVKVTPQNVVVQWYPFVERVISRGDIHSAHVRTYKAVQEFRGWGIKRGKAGQSYTISGDQGVQLVLKSNERILIGSKRSEDFYSALRQF